LPTILIGVMALPGCAPFNRRPPLDHPPQPLVYQNTASRLLFYVETDRCHVSAVRDGKILWTRDMCASGKRDQQNLGRIDGIGPDRMGGFVGISFNTGELGRFKMANGDLIDEGRD
jgi:hypothetical protein